MRYSRYMIFLYAAMLGVPLLLYIRIVSSIYGLAFLSSVLLAAAGAGLVIFGIIGFDEVYAHKGSSVASIAVVPDAQRPVKHMNRAAVHGAEGSRTVAFRIRRFDAESGSLSWRSYMLEADRLTTVLGALVELREKQDPTLSMRYNCRMGICGSCGMVINGKPSLACETNVFDSMTGGEVAVEPMYGHPLLKGLVTDFDDFFEKHISVNPWIYRKGGGKFNSDKVFGQSREQTDRFLPYSYCIMCGLCQDACPVANANPDFLGPQALSQVYRYHADSRDQRGDARIFDVDTANGVWGCEFAGACSKVCPKGVDPAAAIQLLKGELFNTVAEC